MAQVIYNKHTRDVFQAAISRGNPNLVTPVELDFSLPRNIALAQQCQVLLNWETSYKALSRQAQAQSSYSSSSLSSVAGFGNLCCARHKLSCCASHDAES